MNKNKDLVSIIVTVYKSYNYLNDLIKSVESQSYKNYELILLMMDQIEKLIIF